jgi:hypothetical protein
MDRQLLHVDRQTDSCCMWTDRQLLHVDRQTDRQTDMTKQVVVFEIFRKRLKHTPLNCALYTVHCALYTVHCTLYAECDDATCHVWLKTSVVCRTGKRLSQMEG